MILGEYRLDACASYGVQCHKNHSVCMMTQNCCFNYIKGTFKQLWNNRPTYAICYNFMEERGVVKSRPLVTQCPDVYRANEIIRVACEDPESLYPKPNLYATTVDSRFVIYSNEFCAQCHNVSQYNALEIVMFCNDSLLQRLTDPSINVKQKLQIYYSRCQRILVKTMLETALLNVSHLSRTELNTVLGICNNSYWKIPNRIDNATDLFNFFCQIGQPTISQSFQNGFCDIYLWKRFSSRNCYIMKQLDPDEGPKDFMIPSFATLIDFKQPSRLFVNYAEFQDRQENCQKQNVTDEISWKTTGDFCLMKTCNSDELYNTITKSCNKLNRTLQFDMILIKSMLPEKTFLFVPWLIMCSVLKTDFVSTLLPNPPINCFISDETMYGIEYSNFGIVNHSMIFERFQFLISDRDVATEANFRFYLGVNDTAEILSTVDYLLTSISAEIPIIKILENRVLNSSSAAIKSMTIKSWNVSVTDSDADWLTVTATTKSISYNDELNWTVSLSARQVRLNCMFSLYHSWSGNSDTVTNSLNIRDRDAVIVNEDGVYHFYCTTPTSSFIYSNKYALEINIINIIITPVSMAALLCTIVTYLSFQKLRNLSGTCTTHLSACLLVNYSLFYALSILKEARLGSLMCLVGAILHHCAAMSVFSWSLCTGLDAHLTLANKTAVRTATNGCSRWRWLYLVAGYIGPLCWVGGCVASHLSGGAVHYVELGLCWLQVGDSVLLGMTLPAGLCFTGTLILLAHTLIVLVRTTGQTTLTSTSARPSLLVAVVTGKLSVLLGVAWLFPALNIVVGSSEFDVFCNVFISGQGFLVALCFLTTPTVRKLYRKRFARMTKSASASVLSGSTFKTL